MKKYFLLLTLTTFSCMTTKQITTKTKTTKNDKIAVYQIFTRLFGNQNSTNKFYGSMEENGVGKMNDISEKALQEIKNLGISHVWFTGIIEHATMTDFSVHGILPDNPSVVKGRAGSPYAIKDYYDVSPELAVEVPNRMKEFEALVARCHALGLKVIVDFVPNHVARSYNSDAKPKGVKDFGENDDKNVFFSPNNNFYYIPNTGFVVPNEVKPPVEVKEPFVENPAKATGNDVFSATPSINDWFETIKLNYGVDYQNNKKTHFENVPDTWHKMKDILLFWQAKGVDGFRCDMAEMVPVEFWGWVIPQIKEKKSTIFIAEIYNPNEYQNYIFNGKFDYLYDKVGLYDALRRLIQGGGSTEDITKVWQNESGNFAEHMLRFLENHDEQRIASDEFAGNAVKALPAMMLSATLHSGPLMVYFGQELGVKPTQAEGFQGNDGRTTIFDYWGVPEFQGWTNSGKFDGGKLTTEQKELRKAYEKIIKFSKENEAVTEGKFWDLQYVNTYGKSKNYSNHRSYSYVRYTEKQRLLFVFNFDLSNSLHTFVKLPNDLQHQLGISGKKIMLTNALETTTTIEISTENCLENAGTESGIPIQLAPNSFIVYSF